MDLKGCWIATDLSSSYRNAPHPVGFQWQQLMLYSHLSLLHFLSQCFRKCVQRRSLGSATSWKRKMWMPELEQNGLRLGKGDAPHYNFRWWPLFGRKWFNAGERRRCLWVTSSCNIWHRWISFCAAMTSKLQQNESIFMLMTASVIESTSLLWTGNTRGLSWHQV